jgi:uncharacterized coiled-coil DUF342 family protein
MNSHEYITKLQVQADEIAAEIRKLKAEIVRLSHEAKMACEAKIAELQQRRDQLLRRMEMMQDLAVI